MLLELKAKCMSVPRNTLTYAVLSGSDDEEDTEPGPEGHGTFPAGYGMSRSPFRPPSVLESIATKATTKGSQRRDVMMEMMTMNSTYLSFFTRIRSQSQLSGQRFLQATFFQTLSLTLDGL
jgi:hypothetical protein